MARDLERDFDQLASGLNDLRSNLGTLAERFGTATEHAVTSGRRGFDRAAYEARRGVATVHDGIGDRPMLAVGIAFVLGILIGRFAHRD